MEELDRLMHTASVRNIIIRWTSHDDLTEKYEETFFHFIETTLTHKTHERTKIQNCTLQFDKKNDSVKFHLDTNHILSRLFPIKAIHGEKDLTCNK